MVYVLNRDGQPLMPTNRYGRVKHLLKEGKAVVVKRCPFTIKLNYQTTNHTQPITLGVDAGSKHVGFSACTATKEVYSAELTPRNDVVDLLSTRREFRRARRNRKTRYRAPRFDNRVRSKHKGWLAPSVEVKIQEHITAILRTCRILPISKIIVETAEFDTQRLKAMLEGKPLPVGTDYQLGALYDEYNVRQYVLKRDNYTCQCCGAHNTSRKEVKFHVHHIESRKTGGNTPNNLITLCEQCHKNYHNGLIDLPEKVRRIKPMRDAAFMGVMRKTLILRLRALLSIPVKETYGYITKLVREQNNIAKSHINDARCIVAAPIATPCDEVFLIRAVRLHNRQLHKATILKGGIRKRNQCPYKVFGYRLWDKVLYNNIECFISGRRASGFFSLRRLDGSFANNSVNFKKLRFLEHADSYITERSARIRSNSSPV